MTAKDAVKLQPWLNERHWVVEVEARLPEDFLQALSQKLK
jgi:tetraacyldisaccharide 4'-kinase